MEYLLEYIGLRWAWHAYRHHKQTTRRHGGGGLFYWLAIAVLLPFFFIALAVWLLLRCAVWPAVCWAAPRVRARVMRRVQLWAGRAAWPAVGSARAQRRADAVQLPEQDWDATPRVRRYDNEDDW